MWNAAIVSALDTVLQPVLALPPLLALLVLSLPASLVVIVVVAWTTNQAELRRAKRHIHAALLEMRLFNDEPRAVLRAVGAAFRSNLRYLQLSLLPLIVLAVPATLFLSHLNSFYGYAGLAPGSAALVEASLQESAARGRAPITLDAPDSVVVESGPAQLIAGGEVLWRIRPRTTGRFVLTLRVGDETVEKTLVVSDDVVRRSYARTLPGIVRQLAQPSEPPLRADGPLSAVTVGYPSADVALFGVPVHWAIVYFAFTMGWTLLLSRWFGVSV